MKGLRKVSKLKNGIGYYNELQYRIEVDGNEVYRAGNSKFDSQDYVSAKQGVGLAKMKKYCEQTLAEMAMEQNFRAIGVEYEGIES